MIEVNGPANTLLLLDKLESALTEHGELYSNEIQIFSDLRKQANMTVEYMKAHTERPETKWHEIVALHEHRAAA